MTLIERLAAALTAIKVETKTLRTFISGANNGTVAGLTTVATNLVAAINEVKASIAGFAAINDTAASGTTVYSSNKTETRMAAVSAADRAALKVELLGGAGPTIDTLKEIADLLTSNTSTDAALAATVANKANSSDVYTQAQMGNPDTDLVAIWNAA